MISPQDPTVAWNAPLMADLPHDIIALSAPNLCTEWEVGPNSGTDKKIRTVYLYSATIYIYLKVTETRCCRQVWKRFIYLNVTNSSAEVG